MGYDVHISRYEEWSEEAIGGGISLDEWKSYIQSDPSMRLDGFAEARTPGGEVIRIEGEGLAVWTGYSRHDEEGIKVWFDFRNGRITVKNPDFEILQKMYGIASQFSAKVLGDEGEEYDVNGRVVESTRDPSALSRRPWWWPW